MNRITLTTVLFSAMFLVLAATHSFGQSADITEGCAPLTVQFTAPGTANSYYWDFKDGGTSTDQNPGHIFSTPDTYVVEFKETAGGTVVGTVTITVFPKPKPDFTAAPTKGCAPLDVQFNDASDVASGLTVTNYHWVFGDGTAADGLPDPVHTYAQGVYSVALSLTVDKTGCDTTAVYSDLITASNPDIPSFVTNPNPPVTCNPPLTVSFTNTTPPGGYTFHWDFGNGNTFDGPTPPAQTYTSDGTYPVVLSLTDAIGCVKTSPTTLVGIGAPHPSFTIPNDTLCLDVIYSTTNTSPAGTYEWTFQDAIPATSTQIAPNFKFISPGLKTITLSMTSPDGLCSGDTTITVFVEEAKAAATVTPQYSCSEPVMLNFTLTSQNISSWVYIFGDGTTSTEANPTHLYVDKDTTTYSKEGKIIYNTILKVTTAAGCVDTVHVPAIINTPNALFLPDIKDGCAPLTVNFDDMSTSNEDIVTWQWDFGDGTTITATDSNTVEHIYTQPGEYPVQLIIVNSAGCTDTSYVQIIYVGGPANPDFSVDKTDICIGDTVYFSDLTNDTLIDAYHISADGDRLFHCTDDPNPGWVFHQTGQQDVKLEVIYNGCHSEVVKQNLITVHGPLAKIEYEMDCATPHQFTFTSQSEDADNVTWNFGDGTNGSGNQAIHTYAAPGDYSVILTATNNSSGCPPSMDTVRVHVRDLQASFELPPTVCKGQILDLNASASTGVNVFCNKGYQWNTSETRPFAMSDPIVPMSGMNPPLPYPIFFGTSGPQWVELVVEDINGCRDTLRKYTTVYSVEVDVLPQDTLICLPNSISFSSTTTSDTTAASWTWDFGDGQVGSGANPTHLYTSGNGFAATLTVKDVLGCEGQATANIAVYQPVSNITTIPNPPHICVGQTVDFGAADFTAQGSFLHFNWNFGNGVTSTDQNASVTYNTAGDYQVQLTYFEDATGCPGEPQEVNVSVQDYPVAGFSSDVDGQTNLCYPLTVEFTDQSTTTSPLSYYWDFGNGATAVGDVVNTVFGKGQFDITHIVTTSNGCADTIVKSIQTTGPEGDFTLDKNVICLGEEVTVTIDPNDTVDVGSYHFDFGDGTIVSDQTSVTHSYSFLPGSNQQPIKLVLTSVDGNCSFTVEKIITILNTQAEFTNGDSTLTGCSEVLFSFVNLSTDANQFQWDFGDGSANSNLENPTHVYHNPGTYDVTLIASNSNTNCVDTVTHQVVIQPSVPVSVSDVSLCQGDTIQLSVNNPQAGTTYTWEPAAYVNPPAGATTMAFPPVTTQFVVTADDGSGCVGMDTLMAYVVTPLPDISFDTTIFAGTTIQLPVEYNPPYVFSWTPESGLSCLICSNPSVTPNEDITYQLSITDDAGCFTSTGVFVIRIFPEKVEIPNAFTPNNDGNNDFFNIVITDDVAALLDVTAFKIFDRWGQKIYDNDNPDKGWDGKFKGKLMPPDVYPFVVEVTFLNGKKKQLKGAVTLIR